MRALTEKPHDAVVKFDTYQITLAILHNPIVNDLTCFKPHNNNNNNNKVYSGIARSSLR